MMKFKTSRNTTQSIRTLVVGGKLSGLGGDTLKDIVDEGVHDGHSLLGDTGIRVDLLQHLVDVRRVGLDTLLVLLAGGGSLLGAGSLLGRLLGWSLIKKRRVGELRMRRTTQIQQFTARSFPLRFSCGKRRHRQHIPWPFWTMKNDKVKRVLLKLSQLVFVARDDVAALS